MIGLIILDAVLLIVLTVADLWTKHAVTAFLASKDGYYEVIKDVLAFRYSENTGAAFGFLSEHKLFLCIFVAIVLCVLLGFLVWNIVRGKYKQKGSILMHVSVIMVIAGGLGNLYDRIALGFVRDFIEYTFISVLTGQNFPICNVADIFLCIGVAALIAYILIFYGRSSCGDINSMTKGTNKQDVTEVHTDSVQDNIPEPKKCEKCDNNVEETNSPERVNSDDTITSDKRNRNG